MGGQHKVAGKQKPLQLWETSEQTVRHMDRRNVLAKATSLPQIHLNQKKKKYIYTHTYILYSKKDTNRKQNKSNKPNRY